MPRLDPWFRIAELALRPPLALWFNWRLEGLANVPADGPVLVAANHVSYFDPLAHAYLLVRAGRHPRFLAKTELFAHPVARRVLEGAGQIEVERGTGSEAPVEAARRALRGGETVVVYPEGTVTRRPDFSPMEARTGIARLTLSTAMPVLPLAVWGSQHVWRRGVRSPAFGRPIWVTAGAPLDFSEYEDRREDPAALREVAGAVMDELSRLVDELRSRYPKRWSG